MNEAEEPLDVVTLVNVGNGAAIELFGAAFAKVLDNIADPNTDWKAGREVKLTFIVKPNEDRNASDVTIKCVTKLAGLRGHQTYMYLARQPGGQQVAVEFNPQQKKLFDQEPGIRPTAINGGKR